MIRIVMKLVSTEVGIFMK